MRSKKQTKPVRSPGPLKATTKRATGVKPKPRPKISMKHVDLPMDEKDVIRLLDMIGVVKKYQYKFMIKVPGGYSARPVAAAIWVNHQIELWDKAIIKLRKYAEEIFDDQWPPESIKTGMLVLVMLGFTNQMVFDVLQPVLNLQPKHRSYVNYYRHQLTELGMLAKEDQVKRIIKFRK